MNVCQKLLVAGFGCALLYGCVTPNTMLVNPSTGEVQSCSASGWGYVGAPLAQMSHNKCVENLKSIGYKPVEGVEPSVLRIETTPPGADLYVGPEKDRLDKIGVAPISRTHPNNSRMWSAECYQAKLRGYKDSEIVCKNQVWGDRYVHLELEKE